MNTAKNISTSKLKPVCTEFEVSETLLKLGSNPANKGYKYITYALILLNNDFDYYAGAVVKHLYADIATHWNVTASRVERCIRHEINLIFEAKSDFLTTMSVFSNTNNMCVSKFLVSLYEHFRIKNGITIT